MEQMISRRRLLGICAVGGMGALAGCADPDVAMFVDPVRTDREIGEQATHSPDRIGEYTSLVANATANGTNVSDGGPAERPPYRPDRPVVYNGTVYDIDWESTGRQERHTEYSISTTVHDDDRETEIEFQELPAVDRNHLEGLQQRLAQRRPDDEDRPLPRREYQRRYAAAERNESVLVPDQEYDVIRIEGQPVSVDVRSTTVEDDIYRYTATEQAPTLAAFGSQLRTAQFELTGLTESEQEFFEMVISDGSYYQGSLDDDQAESFEGVADVLVDEPAIFVEDRMGEWLVEYNGSDYWVEVDFVRMAEYADHLEAVDSLENR